VVAAAEVVMIWMRSMPVMAGRGAGMAPAGAASHTAAAAVAHMQIWMICA
jgi:hypothetical protein